MNELGRELVELFLQEASERLEFLREYAGILQDPNPPPEHFERLHIASHTLARTSASYGFPLFSEIASKLAHIFQYAMTSGVSAERATPLVEFIFEALAMLESDLILITTQASEADDDISAFKQRFPFAFPTPPPSAPTPSSATSKQEHAATIDLRRPAPLDKTPGANGSETPQESLPKDDRIPPEVLAFLVPEAEEHLQVVADCLRGLETDPGPQQIHRLLRAMHTVKSSAAQVGLHRVSHVAHRAEDLIGRLRDGDLKPNAEIINICLESVDVLKQFLYRQWADDDQMQATVQALLLRMGKLAPAEKEDDEADAREPSAMPQSKSVQIALERLDRMMNAVGDLVINRTRMLGRVAELERLADVLNFSKTRLQDKVAEFQEKYKLSCLPAAPTERPSADPSLLESGPSSNSPGFDHALAEFSELEMDRYDDFNTLSRSLTEISADITEVLTQLDGFVRRVDGDVDEFTKLAHRLQDEITQARMVPIGNLYTRLSRTVRGAASAAGKKVELTLAGAETVLDNNIIQQISDPLIHLVRNAVVHGLERDEERSLCGKSDHGRVAVRTNHRGNHIDIEVEDDGRGIDYEKVRKTAVENGLISAEGAAGLGERALLEFLFQPGFSIARRKTELAGRGVGLDVVRSNLALLNGEIEIDTIKGRGTRFTLKLPLTPIISQALFVRCGKTIFALPLAFVEEIRRLKVSEIEQVGGKLITKVRDVATEVVRLDIALGLEAIQPINGYFRMVIVNVAGRQAGLVVEDVVRKDEIVIKSLGEYLRNLKLFPGATIAPDGSLILVIDVNRLVAGEAIAYRPLMTGATAARMFAPGTSAAVAGSIPAEATDFVAQDKVVILVDDSISVRTLVGRMLEKAGYRVRLAADGLEALEIASQTRCDMVVTDLEMPRTNGYELLAHLRQEENTRSIPVMVVTSRAGAKHRERAMREGAMAFMTKPVQEEPFLGAVARLIGLAPGTAEDRTVATRQ